MRKSLSLLPLLALIGALAFRLGSGASASTVAEAAAPEVNACGCYRDSVGSCYCGKKPGKCVCPGECEPKGCEEKRAKELDKEIEAEARRAREADKKQQEEQAEKRRKEEAPPPEEQSGDDQTSPDAAVGGKEGRAASDDDSDDDAKSGKKKLKKKAKAIRSDKAGEKSGKQDRSAVAGANE
jgi:hypothetical protein